MSGAAFNKTAIHPPHVNGFGDCKTSTYAGDAEPEWFTLPATFNDVMDLRGFNDDERPQDVEFEEPEPEWFSYPVSRYDVIDLQGFEDDKRSNSM